MTTIPPAGWPLAGVPTWFVELKIDDSDNPCVTWRGKGATAGDATREAIADATRAFAVISVGTGREAPHLAKAYEPGSFYENDGDLNLARAFTDAAGIPGPWPTEAPWTLAEAVDAGRALTRLIGATLPLDGLGDFKVPLGHASRSQGRPTEWQFTAFGSRPGETWMEYMPLPTPYRAALLATSVAASRASGGHHREDSHLRIGSATLRAALAAGLKMSFSDDLSTIMRFLDKVGLREEAEAVRGEAGGRR